MQSIFVERGLYLKWKSNMNSACEPPETREIWLSCSFLRVWFFQHFWEWGLDLYAWHGWRKRGHSPPPALFLSKIRPHGHLLLYLSIAKPAARAMECMEHPLSTRIQGRWSVFLSSVKKPVLSSVAAERQKWLWDQKGQHAMRDGLGWGGWEVESVIRSHGEHPRKESINTREGSS